MGIIAWIAQAHHGPPGLRTGTPTSTAYTMENRYETKNL
jgi:hypothetical protein